MISNHLRGAKWCRTNRYEKYTGVYEICMCLSYAKSSVVYMLVCLCGDLNCVYGKYGNRDVFGECKRDAFSLNSVTLHFTIHTCPNGNVMFPLTTTVPTTYRPRTDHIPTTYWPRTDHIPTTYRPRTDRLYRPHTDSSTCFILPITTVVSMVYSTGSCVAINTSSYRHCHHCDLHEHSAVIIH